jgi:uncharacterized membrane protein YeaQ/YmgE (transglycosylase-associated protein family)
LLVGVIAEPIMPRNDPGGYVVTTIMVIVGVLLGCGLGALLSADPLDEL